MEPIADQTRNAVWSTLCKLEWNWRYYDAMADKYGRRYRALRFSALVSVVPILAVLAVEVGYPDLLDIPWVFSIVVAFGVLLVVLTLWDAFSDRARDAATLRVTAHLCDDLKLETEKLWRSIETYRIAPEDAKASLNAIRGRWGKATQRVRVKTDYDLRWQAGVNAEKDLMSRFGQKANFGVWLKTTAPREAGPKPDAWTDGGPPGGPLPPGAIRNGKGGYWTNKHPKSGGLVKSPFWRGWDDYHSGSGFRPLPEWDRGRYQAGWLAAAYNSSGKGGY